MSCRAIGSRILRFRKFIFLAMLVASFATIASAAEPSRYTPGQCKSARLQFIEGLPVVTVAGTPEEMGEQLGTLLKKPLGELMSKKEEIAHGFGLQQAPNVLVMTSRLAMPAFPESQRRELVAMGKAAGASLDTLAFANIVYEISHFPACSTLAIEPGRSSSGNVLFGRNLDFPSFGFLDQYSVIYVQRPEGKHAFASVTFAGVVGVFSGMNDAGLCLAQLEVNFAADNSRRINLTGTPVAMCFRRILEECTSLDEAEKLLREQNRMMMCNLAICDRTSAAVFETTPNTVVRRAADKGVCACTNHFRTKELAVSGGRIGDGDGRYGKLCQCQSLAKVGLPDVAKLLDAANQGRFTMQTMIFEPATLAAHISLGPAPSSSRPLKTIDFAPLLRVADGPITSP
jgi:hypothetical protein